jgi:hypothetical protein
MEYETWNMKYEILKYDRMNEEKMKIRKRKRKSTIELIAIELATSATLDPPAHLPHMSFSTSQPTKTYPAQKISDLLDIPSVP